MKTDAMQHYMKMTLTTFIPVHWVNFSSTTCLHLTEIGKTAINKSQISNTLQVYCAHNSYYYKQIVWNTAVLVWFMDFAKISFCYEIISTVGNKSLDQTIFPLCRHRNCEIFLGNHDLFTFNNTIFFFINRQKKYRRHCLKTCFYFTLSALLPLIKSIEHVTSTLWILIRWWMSIIFDCLFVFISVFFFKHSLGYCVFYFVTPKKIQIWLEIYQICFLLCAIICIQLQIEKVKLHSRSGTDLEWNGLVLR